MTRFGQPEPCVAIAGDGIAAAALACRLLSNGFGVVMFGPRPSRSPPLAVVEALPEATVRLFAEVGLAPQLAEAGAVVVEGFENLYDPAGHHLEGAWAHVDRTQLARACLTEARRRGATLVPAQVGAGPPDAGAFAAVDATGRAARWSRPVVRSESAVATLYSGAGRATGRPGRIVRTEGGWAYRLDHPGATTVGLVTPRPAPDALDPEVADNLGIDDPAGLVRVGARPAAVQWAVAGVADGRLAVGDAALAYSPLAGQGLRFALASALAAAAVLESWRDGDWAVATDYYQAFLQGARRRHLTTLARLDDPAGDVSAPVEPGPRLRFGARVEQAGLNVDGRIATDDACVLDDGGLARWVGGFDLLRLRALVGDGAAEAEIVARLADAGMPEGTGRGLVGWARREGVLVEDRSPVRTA